MTGHKFNFYNFIWYLIQFTSKTLESRSKNPITAEIMAASITNKFQEKFCHWQPENYPMATPTMLFDKNGNKFSGEHDGLPIEVSSDTHSGINESFELNAKL